MAAIVIALLGAESTGKTTLAWDLVDALRRPERRVDGVSEYLREFCDRYERTPTLEEQPLIAAEQSRRIALAAATHDVVIADTTPMQTAVYSEIVFGDRAAYAEAEAWHREHVTLALLTGLDLPWQADGRQRDGPHVRAPVDGLLRAALRRSGTPYAVVTGTGAGRLQKALAACEGVLAPAPDHDEAGGARWRWCCERCGDVDCERRLLACG